MTERFSQELMRYVEATRAEVLDSPVVDALTSGRLGLDSIRAWVTQRFDYVRSVTAWHGLMLRKIDDRRMRHQLLRYMAVECERDDQELWLRFARGWGLSDEAVVSAELCPEVQALGDYLWRVCLDGHVIEAAAAHCIGIKGLAPMLVARMTAGVQEVYQHVPGTRLDELAMAWMAAHAHGQQEHVAATMELMDHYGTSAELRARAKFAARRAAELFLLGLEGCHRRASAPPRPEATE